MSKNVRRFGAPTRLVLESLEDRTTPAALVLPRDPGALAKGPGSQDAPVKAVADLAPQKVEVSAEVGIKATTPAKADAAPDKVRTGDALAKGSRNPAPVRGDVTVTSKEARARAVELYLKESTGAEAGKAEAPGKLTPPGPGDAVKELPPAGDTTAKAPDGGTKNAGDGGAAKSADDPVAEQKTELGGKV